MPKKEKRTTGMELDLDRPARLTRRQKTDLATLAAMPDDKIDYSDIPPTTLKRLRKHCPKG